MNCCTEETTKKCCSNSAAETLLILNKNDNTTISSTMDTSCDNEKLVVPATGRADDEGEDSLICPKRRKKRTVSVDLAFPCDCCPESMQPFPRPKKKQKKMVNAKQNTVLEEIAHLAAFLKKEREVLLMTNNATSNHASSKKDNKKGAAKKMTDFYQVSENDTELVAEWRKSGSNVYAGMREKLQRLEDMEVKFGAWENHFGSSNEN